MVMQEDRSMEEGLIQQRHQNDSDDRRITACVVISTFVTVCSSFSFGCASGYSSGAETSIRKALDFSIAEYSAFGSFLNLGAALGALCSGQMAVTLGRRRTLWVCDLFCIFGWLSIAFAKDVLWLDAGRISLGIGVGLISYVVPVYIAEITPKHIRGAFTSSNQLFQNCGLSLIYFFGTIINWRVLAIIGAIPCFIQVIGIYFIPESPRWLAKIGSGKEVEHSLHQLRGRDADVSGESADIQFLTKMLAEDSKSSFYDMFQKKYRRTLVVGIGLMLIQQLSGAAGVTYYTNTIFRKAGFSETLGSMIFGAFVIPKALLAVIFVDKWGRRPLLLASAAGMSIGSLLIGVCFTLQGMDILPELTPVFIFIFILVYFGCFAIGVGGLPWVIMAEIFPINIKVSAGTIVALTSWTSGWFVSFAFNFMFEWSAQGPSKEKLTWNRRYKVALGTADGLMYLHESCQRRIIHRDIKVDNILLTEDFQPQNCDFGLAKWLPKQLTHHKVSKFEGTFGYFAPEYFMHGIVYEKTYVFAFGVLLLELITGHPALDESQQSLVLWAKPLLEKKEIKQLVDPSLGDEYNREEFSRITSTASLCIEQSSLQRPRMSQVRQYNSIRFNSVSKW